MNYYLLLSLLIYECNRFNLLSLFVVQGLLHYQVDNEQLSWSYIFGTLEDSRVSLGILDYSVSQTTLEQVHNELTRAAKQN